MPVLLIETKEDSPEKLAAIAGKDTKYFLMSGEFNDVVAAVNNADDKITVLQGLQNLKTNFTGQAFAVWTGVGLTYDVIYPDYYIEGVFYPGTTEQVTLLPSDPVFGRKDIIVVGVSGAYAKTGVPEDVPVAPTFDSNTEIYISTADVDANATTPANVSEKVVYKENTEFTTFSNSGAVNFNATASPFQGTKHVDVGSFSAGNYLRFTDSETSLVTDYSAVKFFASLKAVFSNTTRFYVRFLNGGTPVSSTVEVISGTYNFNRNTVNVYQQIIIPITAFSFTSGNFNGIEIVMYGSNTSGFRLDNFVLYKGEVSTSPLQKAVTSVVTDSGVANATAKDDVFTFKGFGGLVVSAIGKVISFTQASTHSHFKGVHSTFSALTTAHPTASEGDYAQVNEVGATDVVNYNWDGEESIWVQGGSGGGAVNTDSLPEGSTNLYHTGARVLATLLSGLSLATGGAIVSTDSVLVAFGKLQKQINDLSGVQFKIVSTTPSSGLTGTTSLTVVVANVLIPANTVTVGSVLTVKIRVQRAVITSGNTTYYGCISPTISDTAANLIVTNKKYTQNTIGTANQYVQSEHDIHVRTTILSDSLLANSNIYSDNSVSVTQSSNNTDWTVDQYFNIVVTNAQTDTTTYIKGYSLELKKS